MKHTFRRWAFVAFLIGLAFTLGYVGFSQLLHATPTAHNNGDATYLTIQLFFLESGMVEGPMNLPLQIARFLAPISAAYALVQTATVVFSLQLQRVWLRLIGGHVIVCGLGTKGVRLVEQLRGAGKRVVVIEPDEQNLDLSRCRALGATVLSGRADDPWMLRKAVTRRASTLIAVVGDDGVNIETAVRAHGIQRDKSDGSLQCVIHVSDPHLQNILKQHAIFSRVDDPFELSFFNTFETAARVMLREPPLWAGPGQTDKLAMHVLIVGFGRIGEALISRLVRDWRIDHPHNHHELNITVVDLAAAKQEDIFKLRHPELATASRSRFLSVDVRSAAFASGEFLEAEDWNPNIDAAFVCLPRDSIAAFTALTLRRWLSAEVPIIVRMSEETGIATLLETQEGNAVLSGVRAVGLAEITCNLNTVLGGTREQLAQAIHQGYIQDQLTLGKTVADNPSMRSWHELPPDLKNSNRAQADDIPIKLRAVKCEMRLKATEPINVIEFSDNEIELLAETEHRRFVKEREDAGWEYGEVKDVKNRKSPYLVAWSDDRLPEDVKDYDRNAVRRLPMILAKADYEVSRIE
ncbi:MAG: NAD-binding protein [Planctomycetaceae bacterium]|nr:NAD-binding protein [Planctomycetales bacterium]MCB9924244.1 NAD-binding protein [Planctomycetaceae bacterium]